MTPTTLARLGTLLYGPQWRMSLANALGVNRKSLIRWRSGEWPIPEGVPGELKEIMRERIAELRKEIESL